MHLREQYFCETEKTPVIHGDFPEMNFSWDYVEWLETLVKDNAEGRILIDDNVNMLKSVLDKLVAFESKKDKMDFILDICNGYKKELEGRFK